MTMVMITLAAVGLSFGAVQYLRFKEAEKDKEEVVATLCAEILRLVIMLGDERTKHEVIESYRNDN
jgi:hypothetical protein